MPKRCSEGGKAGIRNSFCFPQKQSLSKSLSLDQVGRNFRPAFFASAVPFLRIRLRVFAHANNFLANVCLVTAR